jgi:hypothetical protein
VDIKPRGSSLSTRSLAFEFCFPSNACYVLTLGYKECTCQLSQALIQNPSSVHFRLHSDDLNYPPRVLSTLRSVLEICNCFGETCWLHHHDVTTLQHLGITFLQEFDKLLPGLIGRRHTAVVRVDRLTAWTIQGSNPGRGKRFFSSPNGSHAVAYLTEALRYKPEGSGIDSRWCRNYSLT